VRTDHRTALFITAAAYLVNLHRPALNARVIRTILSAAGHIPD